jgi:hypothetical protein
MHSCVARHDLQEFLALDGDFGRRIDADTDPPLVDPHDRDDDAAADQDLLVLLPGQH